MFVQLIYFKPERHIMSKRSETIVNMISVVLVLEQCNDFKCEGLINELKALIKDCNQEHFSLVEVKLLTRRVTATLLSAERYLESVQTKKDVTKVNLKTRVHQWIMDLFLVNIIAN